MSLPIARSVGTRWPLRSLPSETALWFYDALLYLLCDLNGCNCGSVAVVAHHNAVGNKTILVFRKQSFTFTFRVKFHTSKLPWDIQFLIKIGKYIFLFQLLQWQDFSCNKGSKKEMEMRTVAERKSPPLISTRSIQTQPHDVFSRARSCHLLQSLMWQWASSQNWQRPKGSYLLTVSRKV